MIGLCNNVPFVAIIITTPTQLSNSGAPEDVTSRFESPSATKMCIWSSTSASDDSVNVNILSLWREKLRHEICFSQWLYSDNKPKSDKVIRLMVITDPFAEHTDIFSKFWHGIWWRKTFVEQQEEKEAPRQRQGGTEDTWDKCWRGGAYFQS